MGRAKKQKRQGESVMSNPQSKSLSLRLAMALLAASAGAAYSQTVAPTNSLPDPYVGMPFGKLPDGRAWGSTAGIAVDPDGKSIWVAERCSAFAPPSAMKPGIPFGCEGSSLAPILKFDENGNLVKSFGAGMFVLPHGLSVDRAGNVWVTDGVGKDGKGHQVFKFSPEGKVLLTLGKVGVAGSGPDEFNSPSAVLVAPNGNIFVADGHGGNTNARIVKFDPGREVPPASSMDPMRSPWIRADGCSSATGATTASRSSTRTATSSSSGRSSADRAAFTSTATTSSTWRIRNPNRSPRITPNGNAECGSAAPRTAP
jgi:DNA-binding beta-propeller fold protein YncE